MTGTLSKTPLYDWHAAHGARLVDFAGWSMPVQYRSIVEEHLATRSAVGLFDVSHMGRLQFAGPSAGDFLERVLTRRVAGLSPGKIRYSLVTNHDGGILDDVLIYRLAAAGGTNSATGAADYQLVVNASNREKIVAWLRSLDMPPGCTLRDVTLETAMIAVQGPAALALVRDVVGFDAAPLKYYSAAEFAWRGLSGLCSRTGYTGEDGCELVCAADQAEALWTSLLAAGERLPATAAGLGARDTLRLEAAMPLYGHELSEAINPYQAGLAFAVDLDGRQFPGRDALARLSERRDLPVRIGLELVGQRPAREHCEIFDRDQRVGVVTSGAVTPTLRRPIAMGYAAPSSAAIGTELRIDVRSRPELARVVPLPFYRRAKKGEKP